MDFKKTYYFIFFFLIILNLGAQIHSIKTDAPKEIEALLLQQKEFSTDTVSLKKHLFPLSKSSEFKVIYQGMLANGYSQAFDRINKKSDYHYT